MPTPEIIDQIQELIFEDSRNSAKSIAEQLDISSEPVGSIIHEDLDMRKLSVKLVPKCLNADEERQRCQLFEQRLELFRICAIQMIPYRGWIPWRKPDYITMTWSEKKQQSMEWWHSISPRPAPKHSKCKDPLEKFSPRFFGIKTASSSLITFQRAKLSRWSITHLCWCRKLKDILKEKRLGNCTKGFLFLYENALPHRALATQKELAHLGFQHLDHLPYSLYLFPQATTCSLE